MIILYNILIGFLIALVATKSITVLDIGRLHEVAQCDNRRIKSDFVEWIISHFKFALCDGDKQHQV